jgi:hypothetical protein
MTGFLSNLGNLYDQTDDEAAQWQAFFRAVSDVFGRETAFSTKTLVERITGDNTLKNVIPEKLGDVGDKGFSMKLGLALRKRRDQVYEEGEGFIQLKETEHDARRQKPQWKLVFSKNTPTAPSTPSFSAGVGKEKNIPEKSPENSEEFFSSSQERAAQRGVLGVPGADDGSVSDYESEERAAIQEEGQL